MPLSTFESPWLRRVRFGAAFRWAAAPIIVFGLSFAAAGCGDDDDDDNGSPMMNPPPEEESVEEELCEHAQDGPFQFVTAALMEAGASDATFEHTRINVTLTATSGQFGGWIAFDAEEAGDLVLGFGEDVPIRLVQASDSQELSPESSEAGTECPEVVRLDTFEVEVGTHNLWFGPTDSSTVGFGFESGEHDHD